MNDTGGTSGPVFLAIYGLLAVLAAVWAAYWRLRRPAGSETPPTTLTVDELAYLVGGPKRVAEAAITRLVASGAMRVSRQGNVTATQIGGEGVERELLSDAAMGFRGVGSLVARAARSWPVERIRERLVEGGLLLDSKQQRQARTIATAPLVVLAAFGVVRISAGVTGGRPVGYLVALTILTVVAAVIVAKVPGARLTRHGARAVSQARTNRHTSVGATGLAPAMTVGLGLVVFGGLSSHPDAEVANAMTTGGVSSGGGFFGGGGGGDGGGGFGGGDGAGGGGGGGGGCGGGGGGCGG